MTTAKEVIQEVRNIAKANPDFRYQDHNDGLGCSYFGSSYRTPTGQRCIIGQAFLNLGVDTTKLRETELDRADIDLDISSVIEAGIVDIDTSGRETQWLLTTQNAQDQGKTWATAVNDADTLYNLNLH